MKREPELVRHLLKTVEESPAGQMVTSWSHPDFDEATIAGHLALLVEEGFFEGKVSGQIGNSIPRVFVMRLTWKGHDFLDASRNDTVWAKAKSQILGNGLPWTMEILKQALTGYARQELLKHNIPLS
jgi:hypothetical protein